MRLRVADVDDEEHGGALSLRAVRLKLYVVHGSHPSAAVKKAIEMKGLEYKLIEWPPPMHAPMQRAIFGQRTVPGLKIDGKEKVVGSRAIMRRLDQLAPEPPLLPSDPAERARVEDAERWGDEVFQPIARELIWPAMVNSPAAMVGYSANSKLPLPAAAVRLSAPLIARLSSKLNRTNDELASKRLAELPPHLDKIDAWIADGTLGGPERPNAADLQIAATVRLMLTLGDVRPLIEGRPSAELAMRLFPEADGDMPPGSIAAA
jgi:glutathione S-transferase